MVQGAENSGALQFWTDVDLKWHQQDPTLCWSSLCWLHLGICTVAHSTFRAPLSKTPVQQKADTASGMAEKEHLGPRLEFYIFWQTQLQPSEWTESISMAWGMWPPWEESQYHSWHMGWEWRGMVTPKVRWVTGCYTKVVGTAQRNQSMAIITL